jgi:hypothetical protein
MIKFVVAAEALTFIELRLTSIDQFGTFPSSFVNQDVECRGRRNLKRGTCCNFGSNLGQKIDYEA